MDIDSAAQQKIEETLTEILKKADMDSATEEIIRKTASEALDIDLSADITYKKFVRRVIESFLVSMNDEDMEDAQLRQHNRHGDGSIDLNTAEPPKEEQGVEKKPEVVSPTTKDDNAEWCRVICKLSNKRNVAVRGREGKTIVSIREFAEKDGKQVPILNKACHLTPEQWSTFRSSIPAIEDAVKEMELKLRSKLQQKQIAATSNRADQETEQYVDKPSEAELGKQQHTGRVGTQVGKKQRLASSSPMHNGHTPVQILRFDGKNYDQWIRRMESFLSQMKVAYVLSEPCPSSENSHAGRGAFEKWINDDYVCRMNILSSLSDNLFDLYSKNPGSAKDLWEQLKHISQYEEHGAKVSLVNKYLEFKMVDGKSMMEQVQELHQLADSIIAAGMYVEEKFHANVIISKFPASWREFGIELMKEDYLPVWLLMSRLKEEEDSRSLGKRGEAPPPPRNRRTDNGEDTQVARRLESQRPLLKKPGPVPYNQEFERDRKFRFCNHCRKKGHLEEQCWLKKRGPEENNPAHEKGRNASM